MTTSHDTYDTIIIGGGPAGMMAAGRAAEVAKQHGNIRPRILLIEKNGTLGKKLLITGGGRSNITNAEYDIRVFLSKFKHADKFLFSAFSQLTPEQTINFFNTHNMDTKIEAEKRVFPTSDSARSVWNVLVAYMKQGGVEILSNSPVKKLHTSTHDHENIIESVELANGRRISGKNIILATGGKSHPETGSTGDGFTWLRDLGHTITDSNSALVPVGVTDEWVKKLQGLALTDVRLTLPDATPTINITGKILFTHFGLSGPAVLNISKDIHELLQYGNGKDVTLCLDLFPGKSPGDIEQELQNIFKTESNKKCKNSLSSSVVLSIPVRLQETLVTLAGIDPDKACHSVTREERIRLGQTMKKLVIHVSHLLGSKKAVVTSGGVSLEQVDFKTMRSRLYNNLYIVGDLLNINRPTGGYSLQLCWTTGYVAGSEVGK